MASKIVVINRYWLHRLVTCLKYDNLYKFKQTRVSGEGVVLDYNNHTVWIHCFKTQNKFQ